MIVTAWLEVTVPVETVNVADAAPAGTVTLDGTDTALEPEESATTAPPEGATAVRTTVPIAVIPPANEFDDRLRL